MKIRPFVLVSLAVVGSLLAAACGYGHGSTSGSGRIVTEQRDFTDFTALDIENIFDIEIVQSDSFSITITADDNVIERVKVSQDGEELKLRLEPRRFHRHITLGAKITMPVLSGLELDGLSRVAVTGFKSSQDLHLDLSEASSLTGDMEAGDVVIEASDASRVTLAGSARTLTLDASDASRVDLADFLVNEASVELSGLSLATVNASERLGPVDLRGRSRLEYLGDPTLGEVDTSDDSAIHLRE